MAQSTDRKDGHTGIRLGVGSILSLGDVRIENGLVSRFHVPIETNLADMCVRIERNLARRPPECAF